MKGNGRRKGLGWKAVRRWRCKEMLKKPPVPPGKV